MTIERLKLAQNWIDEQKEMVLSIGNGQYRYSKDAESDVYEVLDKLIENEIKHRLKK